MKHELAGHQQNSSGWEALLRRYPPRVVLSVGVALYVIIFLQLYQNWLSPLWAYAGFTYRQVPVLHLAISWFLVLLPCLWMPLRLTRPSQFIYWMFYLVVYVPSMFIPYFVHLMDDSDVLILIIYLAGGLFLLGLGYRFKLHRFPPARLPRRVFWIAFALGSLIFSIWVAAVFRGQMKLVSTEDIYSQRAAAKDLIAGGLVGYPMLLLSGMINPVLMALGLTSKRHWLFLSGLLGQVLIYACSANKSVVTSILFIPVFFYLIKKNQHRFGLMMVGLFLIIFVFMFAFNPSQVVTSESYTGIVFSITTLFLMRTVGMPALLIAQFHCFFSKHPITYLSHVNGVNIFIKYPYNNPIGIEIANFFEGNPDVNSNANMWATDGIAGLWLPGILIISIFCAIVFWCLDSVSVRQDIVFVTLTIIFAALNLSNISLFTSLISGGLLPLIIFFYLMPTEKQCDSI